MRKVGVMSETTQYGLLVSKNYILLIRNWIGNSSPGKMSRRVSDPTSLGNRGEAFLLPEHAIGDAFFYGHYRMDDGDDRGPAPGTEA